MQMMSGGSAGGIDFMSILMQMVGAAIRGESPQAFMKRLANQHPSMKKVNFNDLMGSAQQLAKENNVDIDQLKSKLDDTISPMLPNK
jgi:hypothetical protein